MPVQGRRLTQLVVQADAQGLTLLAPHNGRWKAAIERQPLSGATRQDLEACRGGHQIIFDGGRRGEQRALAAEQGSCQAGSGAVMQKLTTGKRHSGRYLAKSSTTYGGESCP